MPRSCTPLIWCSEAAPPECEAQRLYPFNVKLRGCTPWMWSSEAVPLECDAQRLHPFNVMLRGCTPLMAIGSAEELPPRIRANPRGYARTPPGSARIRRTSAKIIFRRTPPNVRRTFEGHRRSPRGYGRIRAESAANWRKSSLEKCPPTKTYLTPLLLAEELPRGTGRSPRVSARIRANPRRKFFRRAN